MAYSVLADVQNAVGGESRLIALADFDGDNVADSGVVDAAIAEADALIESYAGKRWATGAIPLTVKALSARIAARVMRRNRSMTLAEDVEHEKNDRKWLEALAKGDVTAVDTGAEAAPMVIDKAAPRDSTKAVSRERTKGFW